MEIDCASNQDAANVHRDLLDTASLMAEDDDVHTLDAIKVHATSFFAPRTVEGNAAAMKDATSLQWEGLTYVQHMVAVDDVRLMAAISPLSRLQSFVSSTVVGKNVLTQIVPR
jgi:hypothetical protein